ncbi:shikimate dehydrogenase [Streptomyces sp. NPDC048484]|uniref:shikimate dehydrogenase n=1 Tax=Streptomyces sp. NPDC048484 TaxID=3155146 RepID=UPI003439DCB2
MVKDSYLVGLIGAGIGPSLSPVLHEREADRQGLRYLYRRIDIDELGVAPDAVGELVRAARDLGFDGLNITHPCKQLVIEHLDALAPQAEALGAVNTVVFDDGRAVGHNTDVTGFAASFARGLPDAPLERVVQWGAGGAGAAVAHAMLTLGAGHLTVVDALPDRAAELAAGLNRHFGPGRAVAAAPDDRLPALLGGADGVVHATPTGMAAHPGLPFAADSLRPGLWVAEVVYRPLETELVRAAREAGCAVLDGGGMAVFQAADAFRLFTGREPDSVRMLADIEELAGAAGAAPVPS